MPSLITIDIRPDAGSPKHSPEPGSSIPGFRISPDVWGPDQNLTPPEHFMLLRVSTPTSDVYPRAAYDPTASPPEILLSEMTQRQDAAIDAGGVDTTGIPTGAPEYPVSRWRPGLTALADKPDTCLDEAINSFQDVIGQDDRCATAAPTIIACVNLVAGKVMLFETDDSHAGGVTATEVGMTHSDALPARQTWVESLTSPPPWPQSCLTDVGRQEGLAGSGAHAA
ncbi:hypothetical protein PGT21_012806 [Puccinia graminis f. sp. tritici]|uniref:Uncharacterized protein n=1 Tax=Puccinia graminis f. sp. tritici TaxID=56615 RepID=A0A5B0PKU9_PUCGR|nr:hypothetical protein PGT21_012806 [Puccinia graminis f. sp. tritici]